MLSIENKTNNKIKNPKVSIIVPTYRRLESLKFALESLTYQTYQNIEIVVVDDNANVSWNRKVEEVIRAYSEVNNVVYLRNDINQGSAQTRNIGIENSTGDYITFLDDDDIYLPNKISRQVNFMMENELDYSITDLYMYDSESNLKQKRIRNVSDVKNNAELLKFHLMYHLAGTDTMMFKRKYLIKIGMFSPINIGDDFYLMYKAIKGAGKFGYLNECDVKAFLPKDKGNLSLSDARLDGIKGLYEFKASYFDQLDFDEIQYIKMRYYAVIANLMLQSKNYLGFLKFSFFSILSHPIASVVTFIKILNKTV